MARTKNQKNCARIGIGDDEDVGADMRRRRKRAPDHDEAWRRRDVPEYPEINCNFEDERGRLER